MSRFFFKLPDIGEGTAEAEIVKWHAAVGDEVHEEQPLVDVMTDKATVELASPVSGRIVSRNGVEGARAAVGSELVVFEVVGGEAAPQAETPKLAPVMALAEPASAPGPRQTEGKALASPAVRARAAALGVELSAVAGTGAGARVQHADLDAILLGRQAAAPAPAPAPALGAKEDGSEDIKIFGLRRRIAERMQDATRRIPHFTYVEDVDVSELEALRQGLNATPNAGGHLTLLPFLILAVIKSLATHPGVNAHFDDAQGVIRRFKSVHAGIATQTDRGLLVPVIRHAEAKDMWQLAAAITHLSEAARSGKSSREELSGSTITVTSLGALGGIMATPIINTPEVAITGVNKIAHTPVVRGGAVAIAKMMNLSSSFDHRIIDGFTAAAFIKTVKDCLEAPAALIATPVAGA